ncbi:MAG: 3-deoxy-D-manno-octulosonic acid transferase [Thermoanaerobaculia bacterium]
MAGTDNGRGLLRALGWGLYQAGLAGAMVLAGPVLMIRRGAHYLPTLPGRLGRTLRSGPEARGGVGGLWIHAVSVGEVGVAATLARALPPGQPAVVTTITPTGQERARAAFAGRSEVAYLPFDLWPPVRRFFRRFRPAALVLVEGDYWPLVLREAARRGVPVAVVNGRVGDRSFRRMRRLGRLLGPALFGAVERFGVQTGTDAERLEALGVPKERITVTGNLKYETPEPPELPELAGCVRGLAGGRPVLVAGSTMAGEEERVLDAFRRAGGGERVLLVLAPRHPERWDEAAARIEERGLAFVRRSALGSGVGPAGSRRPDVLLLDSLGELASVYRWAAAAFIGGTLVPTGGHNPLEAARWGVPVVVGPSMENFRGMARDFDAHSAWIRVTDAQGLAEVWCRWLEDPEAARRTGDKGEELVEANRGALERTVEVLEPILAGLER